MEQHKTTTEKATIILHSGDMDKLYSALIIGNGAYIPVPGKASKIDGRSMTPDEYYDFIKLNGEELKSVINKNFRKLEQMDGDQLQEWLEEQSRSTKKGSARWKAKRRLARSRGLRFPSAKRRTTRRR